MVNGLLTGMAVTYRKSAIFLPMTPAHPMIDAKNHPNLNGLVELSNRNGVDIRPTLLRVMTDLYVQKQSHTEQEERHYTELALRLIELVDAKTRAIVAAKIAGYPTAPTAVRRRLLKDHILLTVPAVQPETAAEPFAGSKVAADELSELFFAADTEERRLILLNLPFALLPLAEPVAPAAAGELIHRLEAAALGHNTELFARELERTLMISREQARRMIEDPSGEPVVVVAAALDMPAFVLQRILLCLNPTIGQSVQRVYELAVLHEELEKGAALRLIAIWQAAHRAERKPQATAKPAHQPIHWQGDANEPALPAARPKIAWEEHAATRKAEGA